MVFGSSKFFIALINDYHCLCVSAGYENGAYRTEQLTSIMMEALPEFALNFEELQQLKYSNAVKKIREAAQTLYEKDESERGEPGEIILHLLMRDYFATEPVASKIYFTDSDNSNVKGFDIVHTKKNGDDFKIFVGESKLSISFDSAIAELKEDIQKHVIDNFLRKEFLFVGRKISANWPHHAEFKSQIDGKRSLDQIKDQLVFVAFAAYECDISKDHTEDSDQFRKELEHDLNSKLERLSKGLTGYGIDVAVMLLPISSKSELRQSFDRRLKSAKDI